MDIDIIKCYDFTNLDEVELVADFVNEDDEMESCNVMCCLEYKHSQVRECHNPAGSPHSFK